jgi:hypothetical protein
LRAGKATCKSVSATVADTRACTDTHRKHPQRQAACTFASHRHACTHHHRLPRICNTRDERSRRTRSSFPELETLDSACLGSMSSGVYCTHWPLATATHWPAHSPAHSVDWPLAADTATATATAPASSLASPLPRSLPCGGHCNHTCQLTCQPFSLAPCGGHLFVDAASIYPHGKSRRRFSCACISDSWCDHKVTKSCTHANCFLFHVHSSPSAGSHTHATRPSSDAKRPTHTPARVLLLRLHLHPPPASLF